ncbi:hypothetical protein, partial [Plasmodium yoelii yoelii]
MHEYRSKIDNTTYNIKLITINFKLYSFE